MSDMEALYRDALTTLLLRRMSHALQHDLKSPVQGIYWSLELALKGVAGENVDEKTRAHVEKAVTMARKELARLERTSRTFLADAGIADEGEARFDVAELTRETVRHFVTDAAMRNVRLTVDVPPGPVYVRAPRADVAQSVLTCVLNSLDAVPTGGLSEVVLRVDNDVVTIEITDDSPGHASTGEYALDTLGLRLVKDFIAARGGELCSKTTADGKRHLTCLKLPVDKND